MFNLGNVNIASEKNCVKPQHLQSQLDETNHFNGEI